MKNQFLILILQNLVLFPNQEIKLELSNEQSKLVIYNSIKIYGSELIVANPQDDAKGIDSIKELEGIGVFAKIKNEMELPNGNMRVVLRGIKRVKISSLIKLYDGLLEVEYLPIDNPVYNLESELAFSRELKSLVEKFVKTNNNISASLLEIIKNVTNLPKLCDMISAYINFDYKEKRELFKETDYYKRAKKLITLLSNEILAIELENKIEEEVRTNFEKNEKEIIIKEKIKILSNELGVTNKDTRIKEFFDIVDTINVSEKVKENIKREINTYRVTMENSPEYGSLNAHLEFITSLPWNKKSIDRENINDVDMKLNELHYGLEKAKERIKEYLILSRENKKLHSPILCLIGPPGTGKTTFARRLSISMNREFVKISVGGLSDSSELIGHRRTYIGAGPGKIMEGIQKCGVNNPVILIDEVDKMVKDYRGDPASVLLDILDQNQNHEFVDNYVQEPFDLSNVLFILTANNKMKIPRALYDRLEIIEVSSYTLFDKLEIVNNYILPNLAEEYNFDCKRIKFTNEVISRIITDYTKEAGVRDLERKMSSIIRKNLIKGVKKSITIRENDLEKYLGKPLFGNSLNDYKDSGIVNIPAYTEEGGLLLNIEASFINGKDNIKMTGSCGEIMCESVHVAVSYLKNMVKTFKLDKKKLEEEIHIHAPDGTTPKEGPSAGLGITVAMVSEILGQKVPSDMAFTGEITLKGRILKVGGLKEKIVSSINAGIKKIYIPSSNEIDLKVIPDYIKNELEIICVDDFTEVYKKVFN